ncbi:MAG: response regulator transcription factor [Cellvibrionaceae bacterium]|nr:response regulator transcription factor [Cellvibrionaceae bacterium]
MKIVISEDHALYREGLRNVVLELYPDANVMESGDFATTQRLISEHPDTSLLLFDICIPGVEGLNGLTQIKQSHPLVLLVVVSTLDYQASVQQMIKKGADGFISKTAARADIGSGIQRALNGELVVISEQKSESTVDLTRRQIATLELLAKGYRNKQIATELGISDVTVRDYVSRVMRKLEVKNRTEAIKKAREMGIILGG